MVRSRISRRPIACLIEVSVQDHIGVHKSNYTCEWQTCPRRGIAQTSRFALISHIRSHTGEKPFICSRPGTTLLRYPLIRFKLTLHLQSATNPSLAPTLWLSTCVSNTTSSHLFPAAEATASANEMKPKHNKPTKEATAPSKSATATILMQMGMAKSTMVGYLLLTRMDIMTLMVCFIPTDLEGDRLRRRMRRTKTMGFRRI